MKQEIQSLGERELLRLSRTHLSCAVLLTLVGFVLFFQGTVSNQPLLQYLAGGAWVLAKAPLDNYRLLSWAIDMKTDDCQG